MTSCRRRRSRTPKKLRTEEAEDEEAEDKEAEGDEAEDDEAEDEEAEDDEVEDDEEAEDGEDDDGAQDVAGAPPGAEHAATAARSDQGGRDRSSPGARSLEHVQKAGECGRRLSARRSLSCSSGASARSAATAHLWRCAG